MYRFLTSPPAKAEIKGLEDAGILNEKPMLMYVNKRDVPNSMTTLQVITSLRLHNLFSPKGWHVEVDFNVNLFSIL
jgi:hypothetical protein